MKFRVAGAGIALLCGLSVPAIADDYYVVSRYVSGIGSGEVAMTADADTIRATEDGRKIADIASVDAYGTSAAAFTTEFDCAGHAWRVTTQTHYDVQKLMAPVMRPTPNANFVPVADGTPGRAALDFVCAWPKVAAGTEKIEAADPVALSLALSPKLKFEAPADKDGR